jgi:type I restriction enzyme S subunit
MKYPVLKFSDVGKICTGKFDVNHSTTKGKYPFFTCAAEPFKSDTYSFNGESIILPGNGANIGLVQYYNGKFEAYQRTYVLSEIKAYAKYIYYVFYANWATNANNKQYGSATNYIRYDTIANFPIPLPSITDQQRIASILDHADAIRRKNREILEKYNQLAQSVFLEMFGDLTSNPFKWRADKIKNLTSAIIDCPHSTPKHSQSKTEFPCIRTSEIDNGEINWDSMKYLTQNEYIIRTHRIKPEHGDIIYGREGSFGDAVIVPKSVSFALGQRTMLFRPNKEIVNSVFFWAQIRSPYVYRQALKSTAGSTVGHVNIKDIKEFDFLVPPLSRQNEFSEIIDAIDNQKRNSNLVLKKSDELFQSLLQRAYRGEL